MKTILTNSEIMVINQTAEFDSAIGFARAIEAAIVSKIGDPTAWFAQYKDSHEFSFLKPLQLDALEVEPLYAIPFITEDE